MNLYEELVWRGLIKDVAGEDLKDKLNNMSEEEQLKLLSTDGMLVKRPIVIKGNKVLIGFKEKEWENVLK